MKVRLQCPDCNSVWHVHSSVQGDTVCPYCMARVPVTAAAAGVQEPATLAVTAGTPDRSGAGRASTSSAAVAKDPVAARAPSAPDWTDEPIVCPRCKLHFRLRNRPREQSGARKRVLVLDDLAYFREIATDALEPVFDVQTAATIHDAREILSRGGVDLLVLDLTLEGRDAGRDLLASLTPKPCPILIFTAQDESEMYGKSWDELKGLGADDLVIKGMKVAESLKRKASTLLGVPMDEDDAIG